MTGIEVNRIEKSILLRAPRERVWRALVNIAEFSKWFGVETEGAFVPGTRLRMTSTVGSCKGEVFYVFVEQMEPTRKFSWRWHPGLRDPGVDYHAEPTTLVEFELEDSAGGTRLTVRESGFDQISMARRAGLFQQNSNGWEYQLKQIEQYVGEAV